MPVISKQSKIIKGDKITRKFEFTVMYSQSDSFYIDIPKEFLMTLATMDGNATRKYGITYSKISGKVKAIISAALEQDAIVKFHEVVRILMDTDIVSRDVIIVFFLLDDGGGYNSHKFNTEHEKRSAQFGLTYAIETTSGNGEKLYRFRKKTQKWNIDKHIYESEENGETEDFRIWSKNSTIIDDTPENRQKMDSLYIGLTNLYAVIEEITKDCVALEEFIKSDIKLLN